METLRSSIKSIEFGGRSGMGCSAVVTIGSNLPTIIQAGVHDGYTCCNSPTYNNDEFISSTGLKRGGVATSMHHRIHMLAIH